MVPRTHGNFAQMSEKVAKKLQRDICSSVIY